MPEREDARVADEDVEGDDDRDLDERVEKVGLEVARDLEAEQRRRRVVLNRAGDDDQPQKPVVRDEAKVGRNDPCPCGSGKKYKKCCGA